MAYASYWLSSAHLALGNLEEAGGTAERGLSDFKAAGDPWGQAIALSSAGWLQAVQGHLE